MDGEPRRQSAFGSVLRRRAGNRSALSAAQLTAHSNDSPVHAGAALVTSASGGCRSDGNNDTAGTSPRKVSSVFHQSIAAAFGDERGARTRASADASGASAAAEPPPPTPPPPLPPPPPGAVGRLTLRPLQVTFASPLDTEAPVYVRAHVRRPAPHAGGEAWIDEVPPVYLHPRRPPTSCDAAAAAAAATAATASSAAWVRSSAVAVAPPTRADVGRAAADGAGGGATTASDDGGAVAKLTEAGRFVFEDGGLDVYVCSPRARVDLEVVDAATGRVLGARSLSLFQVGFARPPVALSLQEHSFLLPASGGGRTADDARGASAHRLRRSEEGTG